MSQKKKQFCSFKLPLNVPIYFHTTCILSRDGFQFHKRSSFSGHRLAQKRWAGSEIKGHRCKVPSLQFSHPMTQKVLVITTRDCYILSGSFTTHMCQISAMTWNGGCSLSLWTKSYHIHIERKYPFDISFKMHYLFSRVNFMNLSLIFSPDCFEGRRQLMYT